jgi:hypothetical protein
MIASRMIKGIALLLCASLALPLLAQGQGADPAQEARKIEARRTQLNELVRSVRRVAPTLPDPRDRQIPMVHKTREKYLYSLSAPPGHNSTFGVRAQDGRKRSQICS